MPRILSVGQCGLDHGTLSGYLRQHFDVEVTAAATEADAICHLESGMFDLILVNRKLDADGADGVAIIRRLQASGRAPSPLMLVSNYPDAQMAAVEAGALPGFGKSDYGNVEVLHRLRRVLGEKNG